MNLIICCTPLQVLIAERIIDLFPDEDFMGVMYSLTWNKKYAYYAQRLEAKCSRFIRVKGLACDSKQLRNRPLAYWQTLKLLRQGFKMRGVRKVFLANIGINDLKFLLHQCREATFYSYDDGTLNLSKKAFQAAFLLASQEDGGYERLLRKFFWLPRAPELVARFAHHYTIYKLENVFKPNTYVGLFSSSDRPSIAQAKEVSVFLGQPVYEFEDVTGEKDKRVTKVILERYNIPYYLPHPREGYHVDGVQYIDTPLIAEDYFLSRLKEDSSLCFKVFTYCSTTAVNLGENPRVRFVAIKPEDLPNNLLETYEIIERAGTPIESLPSA